MRQGRRSPAWSENGTGADRRKQSTLLRRARNRRCRIRAGRIDVGEMRDLLETYLALQLKTVFDAARAVDSDSIERKFH